MEITGYNKSQLNEFISSVEYLSMDILPISRHRALSHINNPNASENDLLLFIARENEKMIAYAGVLADEISLNDKSEKCGWFSLFWVAENFRGKGIGKHLMEFAIKSWNDKILVADYVPATKIIYENTNRFSDLPDLIGVRCFMNYNLHDVLPPKNRFFKVISPLLAFSDLLLNLFSKPRFLFYRTPVNDYQIEKIKFAEEKHNALIEKYNKSNFRKTTDHLNWILNFPWILSPENEKEKKRFYFTSYENYFDCSLYEVKKDNKTVGLMMMTIRNGHLKIPFCFSDTESAGSISNFIVATMRKNNLNMVTTFHPQICEELKKSKLIFVSKRNFKRHYLVSKSFETTKIGLNDGDGDCAWT